MARTASFSDKEIMKARQLREQATTAKDLRKALSVLLVAEAGLDTDKTSDHTGNQQHCLPQTVTSIFCSSISIVQRQ